MKQRILTHKEKSELFTKYETGKFTLSQTKEGIVVLFLPEAKDFWVSLNQVI